MVARIEATTLGLDIRYIVTSLRGSAKYLYETVYCGRGQAENFIKLHKAQLASDRTSCRDPRANQMRLILHTAAYWLLHTLRAAAPKRSVWARAEFNTLRLRLIKIAARVVEATARIRVWLPTACPDGAAFKLLAGRFAAAGPWPPASRETLSYFEPQCRSSRAFGHARTSALVEPAHGSKVSATTPKALSCWMERHGLWCVGRLARHSLDRQVAGLFPGNARMARDQSGTDLRD